MNIREGSSLHCRTSRYTALEKKNPTSRTRFSQDAPLPKTDNSKLKALPYFHQRQKAAAIKGFSRRTLSW